MKIVVFSDAHGHIKAVEDLYSKEKDSDLFVFLGDAVGYSPFGQQCFDLINNAKNTVKVIGNHERMYRAAEPEVHCSLLAKQFFYAAFTPFTRQQLCDLANWHEVYFMEGWCFTHTLNNNHIYFNSDLTELAPGKSTFIGHSHQQFYRNIKDVALINPGSLGQNRENKNISQYAVLRTDLNSVKFVSQHCPISYIKSEMLTRKFSKELIAYYAD